jgi:hypothetical protein
VRTVKGLAALKELIFEFPEATNLISKSPNQADLLAVLMR